MIYSPIYSTMFFIFLQLFLKKKISGFQKLIGISENNIVSVELARVLWYWRGISV
jgi:hypothetical protein